MAQKEVEMPTRLARRPQFGGYPVPYFVAWYKDGRQVNERTEGARPHFPTTDAGRATTCRKQNRCWICGHPLGAFKAFVFGPASALAQASYEPPSHRDCARYAMQICPYLINPEHKHVTTKGFIPLPGSEVIPDVSPHNPGVIVMWSCRSYGIELRDPSRGIAVFIPDTPTYVEFWTRGRPATYKEAVDALQKAILDNNMLDAGNTRELAFRVQKLLSFVNEETANEGVA